MDFNHRPAAHPLAGEAVVTPPSLSFPSFLSDFPTGVINPVLSWGADSLGQRNHQTGVEREVRSMERSDADAERLQENFHCECFVLLQT